MEHKDIVLPEIDLSHDEGDPKWHAAGGKMSTPVYGKDGGIISYRWNGLHPGHYREYWELCIKDSWHETVAQYEADPGDVHNAYWYLDSHPVFWEFKTSGHEDYPRNHVSRLESGNAWLRGLIEIDPHKVHPETGRVDEDKSLNTMTEWWFETGPMDILPRETPHGKEQAKWHDYRLDGGAATFEEAVIEMARRVHEHYGNDRRIIDTEQWRNGEHEYEEDMNPKADKLNELLGP